VHEPAEADALVARMRFRQDRVAEAVVALQSAFNGFRSDPWPTQGAMQTALTLASSIAAKDPSAAGVLLDSLGQPFAVNAANVQRLAIAADLARRVNFGRRCVATMTPFEPYPLWNEPFLTLRRDCYREANDPRLAAAQRDLDAFISREAPSLMPSVILP
jgi:hypothetical protein